MPRTSAGILMYKKVDEKIMIFLAHPGGPFFKNKDEGYWGIPKGEVEEGEEMIEAAKREMKEETGVEVNGKLVPLGSIKQKSGKIVHAWAYESDWSGLLMCKSYVTIEIPSGSGSFRKFPEIDKAGFFSIEQARKKMNERQFELVERLQEMLKSEIKIQNNTNL